MSHTATIKLAPIFTLERFTDPAWNRPGRTMYRPGALRFLPAKTTVPLLVDHDESREIGTVRELWKWDWIDGPWIVAHATIEGEPPCWLSRGRGASFRSKVLDRREFDIRGATADVIAYSIVEEVSVLIRQTPCEPLASVLSVRPAEEPKTPAAVPATSDRAAAGETDDFRPRLWDELERVVGYRITDHNFETALAQAQQAKRSPLDMCWAEVMADKRTTKPQVLVRPGIGQILAVGGVPVG